MNKYTQKIISEIRVPENDCCKIAFMSAIIHTAGTLESDSRGKRIVIDKPSPVHSVSECCRSMFGIEPLFNGRVITIVGDVMNILHEVGIMSVSDEGLNIINSGIEPHLIISDCCKIAYLKGAFLGAGSMTAGKSGNRLQFALNTPEFAEDLTALLNKLGIASFVTLHRDKHVVYVKRSEAISDALALMGAFGAVVDFQAFTAENNKRLELNRVNNLECANIERIAVVGADQRAAIKYIDKVMGIDSLPPKLKEVAKLRLKRADYSYGDMAQMLQVSKSNIKYRLNKLMNLYEKLKNDKGENE